MLNLTERIALITELFTKLEATPSRNEKIDLLSKYKSKDEQLSRDIDYALEILDGRRKIGFTFYPVKNPDAIVPPAWSLGSFLERLYTMEDHSESSIWHIEHSYGSYGEFVASLVNRTWRLGIGKSQLQKQTISPMLAKKFEPNKPVKGYVGPYYITEKLDGNRCIAAYNFSIEQWEFYSRSGKLMRVEFDMDNLSIWHIYDGEVMTREQYLHPSQENFNGASGVINSHSSDKDLVYIIFDIVDPELTYSARRALLNEIHTSRSSKVIILPVLGVTITWEELTELAPQLRNKVTSRGGEGIMINVGDAKYQQKRADVLLKYKDVFSMDMRVVGLTEGTGKNEGHVGALECVAEGDGKKYQCSVGSGLTDWMRINWANDSRGIIGKIVEVEYFSISQDANARGTNVYSLRFPRLKRVRMDKNETSIY